MEWLGEDLLQRQHRSLLSSPIHDDPEVLQSPTAVVLGGVRVRCPPQVAGRQVRPGNVVRAEQSRAERRQRRALQRRYGRGLAPEASAQRQMRMFAAAAPRRPASSSGLARRAEAGISREPRPQRVSGAIREPGQDACDQPAKIATADQDQDGKNSPQDSAAPAQLLVHALAIRPERQAAELHEVGSPSRCRSQPGAVRRPKI